MRVHLLILSHHHSCIYFCSIRHCGVLLIWPNQWGVTDISSTSQWLYIYRCRCHLLDVGYCCRALGCSLHGCCGSNRWLYCKSSGYSLYSFWGWWSGDRLSSHFNLGVHVRLSCGNLYGHGQLHSGLHIPLTFHIQMLHGDPCTWSFEAQLYIDHVDRASQQVITDENQLGSSCMLTKQGMDPVQSTGHG